MAENERLHLMMPKFGVSTWKPIPFLRILLPLMAGILLQFYLLRDISWFCLAAAIGLLLHFTVKIFTLPELFMFRWIPGIGINLIFIATGGLVSWVRNIENDPQWIGNHYGDGNAVIVTIQEPLVEKPKSYKALASIESVVDNNAGKQTIGNMLLYLQKDSIKPDLPYGTQLLITKPLQAITNSGNPGGFDYKRYCSFQDIHYQAFLKPGDFIALTSTNTHWFQQWLIDTRSWVLNTLRKYIKGKNEVSVAEALLIGYRDDLDRELVQSYSNTGVVHIIAISGLHLGMIYGMLLWILGPLQQKKYGRGFRPLIILLVLWIFTFIAGAGPSILRSAVMFTCIVLGDAFSKKTSVYNTLAASAFLLLMYNPFYLWDVGFQLSYAAVLSIIVFQKHITSWFFFHNKLLSGVWRLSAITLAAQVLTLPIVLYHFHQFPNLFMLTNLIVVPMSGLILFAGIFLLPLSVVPFIAKPFGIALEWMIRVMNTLIERTDRISFAVTDGIQLTIPQTILLFGVIIFASVWLIKKRKQMLLAAGLSLLGFTALRSFDIIRVHQQKKLIVYNIPQHTAIDIVEGGSYLFYGDTALNKDGFLRNFHLRPSRIVNRMNAGSLEAVSVGENVIESASKKVLIISEALPVDAPPQRLKADVIIISGNPRLYISELIRFYDCNLLVFDATNPSWKIRLWKKDCDSLHLRHYSVPEQGAFEMDL